jgi:hypothetical protein
MATYKDILLKTAYYKEQVTKEMIKKGLFPDDRSIQDRVDRIDKFLAVFSHTSVKAGSSFNTEDFKRILFVIYQDLQFLYQLLYEETQKEYEYVRSYVDAHLKELENLATRYRLRSKLEIDSTSLGETILFQNSGFSIFNRDNATYVDLGSIEVKEGSTLAVLFDANNVNTEQALLGLQDEGGNITYAAPYNYMQDTFTVPGSPVTASYSFDIKDDQIVNTAFEVSAAGLEPTEQNHYLIFGGKDQVLLRESVVRTAIAKDENNSFYARQPGTIEFFIYKGTYANFNFTRQPEGKNFKGNSIENLATYHSVVMKSSGELAFSLATDGEVYAVMKPGIVKAERLFYPEQADVRSFLIEEVKPGATKRYNAFMKIINNNEEPADINSIAIKELNALEVAQR